MNNEKKPTPEEEGMANAEAAAMHHMQVEANAITGGVLQCIAHNRDPAVVSAALMRAAVVLAKHLPSPPTALEWSENCRKEYEAITVQRKSGLVTP